MLAGHGWFNQYLNWCLGRSQEIKKCSLCQDATIPWTRPYSYTGNGPKKGASLANSLTERNVENNYSRTEITTCLNSGWCLAKICQHSCFDDRALRRKNDEERKRRRKPIGWIGTDRHYRCDGANMFLNHRQCLVKEILSKDKCNYHVSYSNWFPNTDRIF